MHGDEVPVSPLDRAIALVGRMPLAKACGVTHQAVRKWVSSGRLPRSEFSGETDHAAAIERETKGEVTKQELLDWSRKGWKRATRRRALHRPGSFLAHR